MKSALSLTVALTALFCDHAAWAAATVHTRIFTGSGTLTVPANVKPGTEYQFTVVGGGGGAGGCHGSSSSTSGGGSGGAGFASFSGFNPSDTITITVGNGGAGGNNSGSDGGNGTTSKLTYFGIDIVASTGGSGSLSTPGNGGSAGAFSATAGSTTLTLQSSLNYAAEDGFTLFFPGGLPLPGGGNPIGHVGTSTNHNGALGGGGLGCFGGPAAGGAGGGGVVIISWTA